MSHYCHVKGCRREVPPRLLMCAPHWRLCPKPLQLAVWRTYRRGQEVTKDPSPEYLAAAAAACEHVAELFRDPPPATGRMGATFKGNPNTSLPDPGALKRLRNYIADPAAGRSAAQQARAEKAARGSKQGKLF